jgi:hypothetical protein
MLCLKEGMLDEVDGPTGREERVWGLDLLLSAQAPLRG